MDKISGDPGVSDNYARAPWTNFSFHDRLTSFLASFLTPRSLLSPSPSWLMLLSKAHASAKNLVNTALLILFNPVLFTWTTISRMVCCLWLMDHESVRGWLLPMITEKYSFASDLTWNRLFTLFKRCQNKLIFALIFVRVKMDQFLSKGRLMWIRIYF